MKLEKRKITVLVTPTWDSHFMLSLEVQRTLNHAEGGRKTRMGWKFKEEEIIIGSVHHDQSPRQSKVILLSSVPDLVPVRPCKLFQQLGELCVHIQAILVNE